MPEEHTNPHRKFLGMAVGVVVDNVDPEKLGRVRVRVPGLYEPASPWAIPFGWPGAGAKKRGGYYPVPKGAEVCVFCNMGDQDHPYYIAGNPGRGEAPDEVEEATPEEATKVFAHEEARYRVVYDERRGKCRLQIKDKLTGDKIELDGVNAAITIQATTALDIRCDGAVNIQGLAITLNGRTLVNNGEPIS